MKALNDAGFDPNNDEHKIVVCGDLFDRMSESQKVYEFAKEMIEKDKMIYILGNHERLLLDCLDRQYALSHDWSNGTVQTILDLAPNAKTFNVACAVVYDKIKPLIDKTVNYVETTRFVMCHGFIPVNCDDPFPPYYRRGRKFTKMENWREASQHQWDDATWLNSYEMVDQGFGIEKTIIAGHWHCSYGRYQKNEGPEFGEDADFSPFYYDDKLIMIDTCTAYSHKVNCLVLEDDIIYGKSS